jgi:hypothetical protein
VVNVKRLVGFLVIALVIFAIITNPTGTAATVQSIGATLASWAESITTFFSSLL